VDINFVPITVMWLCFIMGLQTALITKLFNAEMRTTHITGIATDSGIELGKLLYRNINPPSDTHPVVTPHRARLTILIPLISVFFVIGIMDALRFKPSKHTTKSLYLINAI